MAKRKVVHLPVVRVALVAVIMLATLLVGGCGTGPQQAQPPPDHRPDGNLAPVAVISASRTTGIIPLTVGFDGSESFHPAGGEIIRYEWDFGDGSAAQEGVKVDHVYNTLGARAVRLTVTDSDGRHGTSHFLITPAEMLEGQTDRTGVFEFRAGESGFQLRTIDEAGSPIPGILSTVVTDGDAALVASVDPEGRFLPALSAFSVVQQGADASSEGMLTPTGVLKELGDITLSVWDRAWGGGRLKPFPEYLPRGLVDAWRGNNYRFWRGPIELERFLNHTFEVRDVIEFLVARGAKKGDKAIAKGLGIITVKAGGAAGWAYGGASLVLSVEDELAKRDLAELARWYKGQGYDLRQTFAVHKANLTCFNCAPVIIVPLERPAREGGAPQPSISTSRIRAPQDQVLPSTAAGTTQSVRFTYDVEIGETNRFFTAIITPGDNITYSSSFKGPGFSSGSHVGVLTFTAPRAGETQAFTIHGQMTPTRAGQSNSDSETVSFNVTVAPLPDLTVSSVFAPSSATVGESIDVRLTVENSGGPVGRGFVNRVFLSSRPYGGSQDDIPLLDLPMALGGAGSRGEAAARVTIPRVWAGQWHVVVFADANGSVAESNEHNNIRSAPITINLPAAPPPLVVPVTGVTVTPTSATIEVGTPRQLTATVVPANATNQRIDWASSDRTVATVDATGRVTGVTAGSATITARTVDGGFTAASAITVAARPPVDTTPPTVVSTNPTQGDFSAPRASTITATFSEEVQPGTRTVTVVMADGAGNRVPVAVRDVSVSGRTMTITLATALSYSTGYEVSIEAGAVRDMAGNPNSRHWWAFVTRAPQAPERPTLSAPANGLTGVALTPILQWNPSSGATGYVVSVATDPTFRTRVFEVAVTSTSAQVSPALAPNTRYYWRVVAGGPGGSISSSDVWSFTTTAAPVRLPTVETRAATDVTGTAATIHGVILSDGGSAITERRFDWGTDRNNLVGFTANVTVSGTSFGFRLTGLQPNTTYYFRAWARNSAGWGQSAILSFRTPPAPALVSPALVLPGTAARPGPLIPDRPTLQWNPLDASVTSFAVAISRYPYGPANVIYRSGVIAGRPTSYAVTRNLGSGRYRWQLQVFNAAGQQAFSNILYFQIR